MRFNEIVSADDQLALWRLISDNVWSAVMAQAKEQARLKAQVAATPKPKRIKPKKIVPKKPPAPKPKPPAPKPPPPKSPVPLQARVVTPNRPPPLPSSQPVLRPTHSSSFSQADAYGLQQQTMGPGQTNMPRETVDPVENAGLMPRIWPFYKSLAMGMTGIAKMVLA